MMLMASLDVSEASLLFVYISDAITGLRIHIEGRCSSQTVVCFEDGKIDGNCNKIHGSTLIVHYSLHFTR
jgi:hypothetical protein